MKKIELLYLSQEDVISVGITMEETISIVEDALREHGLGETENPPKPGVHPPMRLFMPCPDICRGKRLPASNGSAVFPAIPLLAFRR